MTVTDLTARRRSMHPSGRLLPNTLPLPQVDRAASLTLLCARWDELVGDWTRGPDALTDEDGAHELLQVLCSALVHPAAVASLCLELPKVLAVVRMREQIRDGIINPEQVGWNTREQALAHADDEVNSELYPLLTGKPIHTVCAPCSHVIADPAQWPTRLDCPIHGQRAL